MCFSSYRYQAPEIQKLFVMVRECPCDFHEYHKVFSGSAQSGEIEVIPTMAPAATIDQHELMAFHQDGEVIEGESPDTKVVAVLQTAATDDLQNSVSNFLRRPVQLGSFVWTSGTMSQTTLFQCFLPEKWLATRMIQEKLQGFMYLRCNLMIEIQINAQPFNAGMGLLWFNPLSQMLKYAPSSVAHFGGLTGYPCAYYRCGDQTSVQLKIPFQANVSHFDLAHGTGTMGGVAFEVLSPLTGAADIDATVWCWAEDVDLQMPTGVPLRLPTPVLSGVAQAGKGDATAQERKKVGPVENVLTSLGGVAAFAEKIPILSPFAAVGKGLFQVGASICSFFGWSKPINSQTPTQMLMMFGKNIANSAGSANCKVLSLDPRIACDIPTEVFGTEEDEMAFGTLLKKETYMDRFLFSGTDAQNTNIWSWPVHPRSVIKTLVAVGTDPVIEYAQCANSMLSYLGYCAQYWRGGITYNLRAVKTCFHSGRLRVTFVPGADAFTDVNSIDLQKCYSAVYDLRESSDMTFTVPYVSNTLWRTTLDSRAFAGSDLQICRGFPTGMIYVTVINALRAPSTAASAIEILAFVKAAPDFQLAYPEIDEDLRMITKQIGVQPLAISGSAQNGFSGSAQSGFIKVNSDDTYSANQQAIGELFTGFRQWLKRYSRIVVSTYGDFTEIQPYATQPPYTDILDDDLQATIDPWRYASVLYRYMSGSTRICINRIQPILDPLLASLRVSEASPNFEGLGEPLSISCSLEPIVEFEIPFYQEVTASPTGVGDPYLSNAYAFSEGGTNYRGTENREKTFLIVNQVEEDYNAYRAAGESFSLGFIIGPPITALVDAVEPPESVKLRV